MVLAARTKIAWHQWQLVGAVRAVAEARVMLHAIPDGGRDAQRRRVRVETVDVGGRRVRLAQLAQWRAQDGPDESYVHRHDAVLGELRAQRRRVLALAMARRDAVRRRLGDAWAFEREAEMHLQGSDAWRVHSPGGVQKGGVARDGSPSGVTLKRASRRLVSNRPQSEDDMSHMRRLSPYHAAVERVIVCPPTTSIATPAHERAARHIRRRLGIPSPRQHRALGAV